MIKWCAFFPDQFVSMLGSKTEKRSLNKKPINAFWLLRFSHNVKNKFEKLFTEIIYH